MRKIRKENLAFVYLLAAHLSVADGFWSNILDCAGVLYFLCGTASIQSITPRNHTEEDSFSWNTGRILWKTFFRNMKQLCHNHCFIE
ncbi:hypothetical protein T4E_10082 [Trichinella pseudospiralis]|uniref:Uncharacterized protein n=1 Tax=Trichinella pseudospiralis TaxID=6337 RepID=A0A0V0YDM8_TRIPS|nr:hypothetical protein T4E_10082 [Trichinella pseudospiralis]